MSILHAWRGELRPLIPRGFLRRDRGAALFISDFPRHDNARAVQDALTAAGFTVGIQNGAACIGVTEEKLRTLLAGMPSAAAAPTDETLPLWALARRLEAAEAPLAAQPRDMLYETLKALDAGDLARLDNYLRPRMAEMQRKKLPLPAAAGKMILWALAERKGAD